MKIKSRLSKIINTSNKLSLIFLFAAFVIYCIIAYLSKGSFGGGDTYFHYRFARYSIEHPEFLLDLWAKPVFTLLMMPFAQFGYFGAKVGNLFFGFLAGYFAYLIAKQLNYKHFFFTIFPVIFAPIYIAIMLTAMTEVVFSLFLIASIYYFLHKKYSISALIISFIPFVRSEGWLFIALFAFLFLINKKYKTIPLLILGTLIYSIIGYFVFNDFLWIFNKHPYISGAENLYGKGEFIYYFKRIRFTFGLPIFLFIILGTISYIIDLFQTKIQYRKRIINELLIITGSFWSIFLVQSYLWYSGKMSVLADDRFMVCIVPVGAVIVVKGINYIIKFIKHRIFNYLTLAILGLIFIIIPFRTYQFPTKPDPELDLIIKSAEWLKQTSYLKHKIYYYHGATPIFLDINPYDTSKCEEAIYDANKPEFNVPDSSIIIWDAHFSANEGRLPLNRLLSNPNFNLLKIFTPKHPFKTLGNNEYKIAIFQSLKNKTNIDSAGCKYISFTNDSIINRYHINKNNLTEIDSSIYYSINSENPFSPALVFYCDDQSMKQYRYQIEAELFSNLKIEKGLYLVFSIENDSKKLYYKAKPIIINTSEKHYFFSESINIYETNYLGAIIKIYIWNTNKTTIYLKGISCKYHKILDLTN